MSIKSMTGIGLGTSDFKDGQIYCEIRSLNGRYLELNIKSQGFYQKFDSEIRKIISGKILRGKVDLQIKRISSNSNSSITLNQSIFDQYLTVYKKELKKHSEVTPELLGRAVINILNKHGVIELDEIQGISSEEEISLYNAINLAINSLIKSREVEGERLKTELLIFVNKLRDYHSQLKNLSSQTASKLFISLQERVSQLLSDTSLSEQKAIETLAILADKVDINEELQRYISHTELLFATLNETNQGRKIEFITQELSRETNTIGSKCQDATVQKIVIEIKTILERIREQSQNIE